MMPISPSPTLRGPERTVIARLRVPVLLVIFGVAGFLWVLDAMGSGTGLSALDPSAHAWAISLRTPWLTAVLAIITTAAAPFWLTLIVIVVTLAWGFLGRQWWRPLLLALAMLTVVAVSTSLKHAVQRHRPPSAEMLLGPLGSPSFPSGHALAAAVFFAALAYLLLSRTSTRARAFWLIAGAIIGTALVAFSRLYLGYHWLSDLAASGFLAVAIMGLVVIADRFRPAAADGLTRRPSTPEADRTAPPGAPAESTSPHSAEDPP